MKNFNAKKTLLSGLVALTMSSFAFATDPPSTTYSASTVSSGRISTQAATYASVSGTGDSMSHAATEAVSSSTGNSAAGPASVGFNGAVSGSVNAQAYNVSTGSGTGSASAGGWSDASMGGAAALNIPGTGSVWGVGSIDGGMGNAVLNGVDAHVVAGTAQDGYSGGTYAGTVAFSGTTNGVSSTQTADGEAYAGAINFTNGTPAGQTAAARSANSGVEVNVSGAFQNATSVSNPAPEGGGQGQGDDHGGGHNQH